MKTLFVNACINRDRSRTLRLSKELLKAIGNNEVEELILENEDLRPYTSKDVNYKESLASTGVFSDPIFRYARQFKEAEIVVIASPYWESSYNGLTKLYLEHVSQLGLTFTYNDMGIPVGLTSVKKLFYITTRGGYCGDKDDLGYLNVVKVAQMFGVPSIHILSAEGLDIVGNDPEAILQEAISKIPDIVSDRTE